MCRQEGKETTKTTFLLAHGQWSISQESPKTIKATGSGEKNVQLKPFYKWSAILRKKEPYPHSFCKGKKKKKDKKKSFPWNASF